MLIKKPRIPINQIIFTGFLPSFIKIILYKLKGYNIGRNVSIGLGTVVIGDSVQIDNNTKIGFLSVIRAKTINISDHVDIGSFCFWDTLKIEIGQDTRIRERVYVGGIQMKDSCLKIGKRVLILQDTYINPTKPIIIEDDVGIGGSNRIFTHGSWQSALEGYPVIFKPVVIKKNVWLAWNVFVLHGVEIGENSTIGAGSIVNVNIPPNSLGSGNPCKIAVSGVNKWPRKITEKGQIELLDKILIEFCDKLSLLGFMVNRKDGDNYQIIEVGKKHKIIYLTSNNYESKINMTNKKNLTLVYNYKTNKYINSEMTIDLRNKIRFGSDQLGEELVKYLSHYGIRFERKV